MTHHRALQDRFVLQQAVLDLGRRDEDAIDLFELSFWARLISTFPPLLVKKIF